MFTVFKIRKSISRTISRLILAIKKVFSKNLTWFALLVTEKTASVILSIFYTLMSIALIEKQRFLAKVDWIALASLSESNSTVRNCFWKVIEY